MKQILVYADSLSWGIVPGTRERQPFDRRWPGVLENKLDSPDRRVRIIEDCLNGRRTVWDDPFKPGRNGLQGLAQRVEIHSPLALVILMLGTNDFQSMHPHNAWHSAHGVATLVGAIRGAPVEPGMPVPCVLVVAPPPITEPQGLFARNFQGGQTGCEGLAEAYSAVAAELDCPFFDAGALVTVSTVDSVHLDAGAQLQLGAAMARVVGPLLQEA